MTEILLQIDGLLPTSQHLSQKDLQAVPQEYQVPDVSRIQAHRRGRGVKLAGVLKHVNSPEETAWITLHASADGFSASIPLNEQVREEAILIYEIDSEPLTAEQGGPIRFFIPGAATCLTDVVDTCANVKFLDRLELGTQPGRDTRNPNE